MAKYSIDSTTLTGIGDAIRAKEGSSDTIPVTQIASRIQAIEAGGGDIDGLIGRTIASVESNVNTIGDYAFYNCTSLTKAFLPAAKRVGQYSFRNCSYLAEINFESAETVDIYAFGSCSRLTAVKFPRATIISRYSFSYCSRLVSVDFPMATRIEFAAFTSSSKLETLVLRSTAAICTLGGKDAFDGTKIAAGTGYIYAPAALVDSYKAATNWSTYANQFRALESYTVDGTTTGELDPTKTGT